MTRYRWIVLTYVFVFGAIYGEMTQPNSYFLWLPMVAAGGLAMVVKNAMIRNASCRRVTTLLDVVVSLALILNAFFWWTTISIRGSLFLVVVLTYLVLTMTWTARGRCNMVER